jgi:penicillin V acylase-like amidase (Ntn superfamily)
MKKSRAYLILSVVLGLVLVGSSADACLTFCLTHEEDVVYGRSFDWDVDTGAVFVNLRNVRKMAFVLPPEKPLSWVSKYGSVTFNQFSKEVPIGGMNEEGLVIESMVCPAAHSGVDERAAINELQWIQYHLDTCRTVGEVIRSAGMVRISRYAVRLHYLVTDHSGESAVIEFINGKMVHRSGENLPVKVLANAYYAGDLRGLTAQKKSERPGQSSRFVRAARMLEKYDGGEEPVEYAFDVLDAVSQGDFTKWQVVYDIRNRRIHFRSSRKHKTKLIELSHFNFERAKDALMLDVNTGKKGSVSSQFQTYTQALNDKLIKTSLAGFRRAGIMRHIKPEHVRYIREIVASCRQQAAGGTPGVGK